MLSATDIKKIAAKEQIDPGIIEKDYVLSKVLLGLNLQPEFREIFIFKGGTAIKKLYYPDWRYSEDLDFSLSKAVSPAEIQDIFVQAEKYWQREYNLASQVDKLTWSEPEKDKNPGFVGLKIFYSGPLQKSSSQKNNIKIDITQDEPIVGEPVQRQLIFVYTDDQPVNIKTYSLEEILAEKLRSLLERGKSRDYYDVWALLKFHVADISKSEVKRIFTAKCAHKKLEFTGIADFTAQNRIEPANNYWRHGLGHQLNDLPEFMTVIAELKSFLKVFF